MFHTLRVSLTISYCSGDLNFRFFINHYAIFIGLIAAAMPVNFGLLIHCISVKFGLKKFRRMMLISNIYKVFNFEAKEYCFFKPFAPKLFLHYEVILN